MTATTFQDPTAIGNATERKVFRLLEAALDSEWCLVSSERGQAQKESRTNVDWEVDVILAHRLYGFICLEVKGGLVSYRNRAWFQGTKLMKRDPVDQARQATYDLQKAMAAALGVLCARVPVAFGLVFPDGSFRQVSGKIPSGLLRSQILDADVLSPSEKLVEAIDHLIAGRHLRASFSLPEWQAVLTHLNPVSDVRPLLSHRVASVERNIRSVTDLQVRLTDEQLSAQMALDDSVRACVRGPAGTGKTLLALQRARRLVSEGREPILVTPDGELVRWLQDQQGALALEGIDIMSVADLTARLEDGGGLARDNFKDGTGAGMNRAQKERRPRSDDWSWNQDDEYAGEYIDNIEDWSRDNQQQAAEIIVRGASELPSYQLPDALLVDEAQALEPELLGALEMLLRDPQLDPMYIFADPFQRMVPGRWSPPTGYRELSVTTNLRNSRPIGELVSAMGCVQLTLLDVDGPEPRVVVVPRSDTNPTAAAGTAVKEVERLIDEGVKPGSIVVLADGGCHRDVANLMHKAKCKSRLYSIMQFRGCEAEVIVAVLGPGVGRRARYVAASRARSHLVVVATVGALIEDGAEELEDIVWVEVAKLLISAAEGTLRRDAVKTVSATLWERVCALDSTGVARSLRRQAVAQ